MALEDVADEAIGPVIAADKAEVLRIVDAVDAARDVAQLLVQQDLLAVRADQPQVQSAHLWGHLVRIRVRARVRVIVSEGVNRCGEIILR